jgi:hypothetical protein
MNPSRWSPFAVRCALHTAIDYYEVLRLDIIPSDAAVPVLTNRTDDASSPVPLICLSLDLGAICTPEVLA